MSVTAYYGGYQHTANSVFVENFSRQTILGETGWPERLRINATICAKLLDTSMAGIMNQAFAMVAGYSVGGQTFTIADPNNNRTVWTLDSPSAIGGVTVTSPVSWGKVQGAEGTMWLYCHVGLQAEYNVGNGRYSNFRETVSFRHRFGLPLTVERVPWVGQPIIQRISQASFFYATQSGELWSQSANPQPMDMLAPGLLRGTPDAIKINQMNPKTIRGVPYLYGVSWSYDYVSNYPIEIYPNVY